jgi:serine/threonine-protein kinase RsbW
MPVLRLPAAMESFEAFRSFVFHRMEHDGMAELLPEVDLALEEVLINAINYAYPKGNGEIEIDCHADGPASFYLAVMDWGIPFNPLEQPPPDLSADISERAVGGLGIYLVKDMAARLAYEHKDGRNTIMMWFEKKE